MSRRSFVKASAAGAAVVGFGLMVPLPKLQASSQANNPLNYKNKITQAERQAAAIRSSALRAGAKAAGAKPKLVPVPGGVPDYFAYANWAYSPMPTVTPVGPGVAITGVTVQNGGSGYTTPAVIITGGGGVGAAATAKVSNGVIKGITITNPGIGYTTTPTMTVRDPSPRAKGAVLVVNTANLAGTLTSTGGMRKFVDTLPQLGPGGVNNLGQYLPVASADTTTYPGSDYYEIELREYTEQMHSDLPPTRMRGYVQVRNGVDVAPIHYLGPIIVATRDRPVRVKFTNTLPIGAAGNLFIPVDPTVMGAGPGPLDIPGQPGVRESYKDNRATIHLHGALSPWISDGTPYQWTVPAGETTQYPKGVSVGYVPDMWFINGNVIPNTVGQTTPPQPGATNNPGPGMLTFYYTNQQSARLLFYHDHAHGTTRLNVYAGEAAGYLITDEVEQDLINGTNNSGVNPGLSRLLPGVGIPLVVQDRSWVDATTISAYDPTWNWGTGPTSGPVTQIAVTAGGAGYTSPPSVTLTGGGGTGAIATATVAGGGVTTVTITNAGSGYTTAPAVTFTGGGGTGAAATATIGSGTVSAITLANPGSGYMTNPTVALTGGGGTGATATAVIIISGISAITLTNPGAGYTTPPTVALTGGGGTGATATAILASGPVDNITVTNPGGRYSTAPTVTITGGGGNGATATATIANGSVTAITVTNGGTGYTSAPTVTISGGGGSGATAIANVPGATGVISTVTITNPGSGYSIAPIVSITGGGGAGATATATLPSGAGTISNITVTNPGSGYSTPPTVSITGGGGTGATATATVQSGVTGVTITNPGTGYNNPPTVGFVGGGGAGVTATAAVGGRVTNVTVTNGGSGYTSAPVVVFSGGGGTGAMAVATVTTGAVRVPNTGDLWYPHVYVPAQNPYDPTGANPYGRWHYAPWFWPPATNLTHMPVPNPYYDPINAPWEAPFNPGTPNPSTPGEAFMDTPIVNGTAYPTLTVEPKAYRFRILSVANDRFFNLQFYVSGLTVHATEGGANYSANPTIAFTGGGATVPATAQAIVKNGVITDIVITNPGVGYTSAPAVSVTDPTGTGAVVIAAFDTEVKMVDAVPTPGWPVDWPTDGRVGGVPDPTTAGPDWIMIGTEGGFLPKPVVVPNQPVTWNNNPTTFNFGNVALHSLLLGPAERADVIVDFTAFAGKTLIMYNDAPAAFPALDTRYDYYTNNPDETATGGAPKTMPGFGPNVRTVMQIKVLPTVTTPFPFTLAALEAAFAKTATKRGVFEASQDPTIIPSAEYNSAYDATNNPAFAATPTTPAGFPVDPYVRQHDISKTIKTVSGATLTIPLQPKAMQDEMGEVFDIDYGRMSAMLGLELPSTVAGAQNFMVYGYDSPPVDILVDSRVVSEPTLGDGTQIWRITHNGVDTHTIHFHLFDVQIVNRVAWDGSVIPPDLNELGWKETVRVNPLEHTIVAMRPVMPTLPFRIPNSIRPLAPASPLGEVLPGGPGGFLDTNGTPVTVTNRLVNFGHEYVYHCHLLAHEEMDMMHGVCFGVAPQANPTNLNGNRVAGGVQLNWNGVNDISMTDYTVQRATDAAFSLNLTTFRVPAPTTSYLDTTAVVGTQYYYRVVASNVLGDTTVYAAPAVGFPIVTVDSNPSNTVGPI